MKAKSIYYKKLFNLGNYTNEEIGIELEIEQGEKAADVLKAAKSFVESMDPTKAEEKKYQKALAILENKGRYLYAEVEEAEKVVKLHNEIEHQFDLPF
jgi:uncharacterized protein (DUF2225 family)